MARNVLIALCLGSLVLLAWAGTARSGPVRFYVDALPPYAVLHDDGPPTGFAVELMGEMMRLIGEPFDPADVSVMNWARAVDHVEVVPDTALLVMTRLPERVDRYKWVGPLDELPVGVIARKDSGIVVNRLEDLLRYRVGIVRNTAPYRVLISRLPEIEANLDQISGIPALLRMLRERRVDVIVQALMAVRRLMGDEGMNPDEYAAIFMIGPPMPIYFGFNKGTDDAFLARLQATLDRLKQADASGISPYARMRARYYGEPIPGVAGGAEAE